MKHKILLDSKHNSPGSGHKVQEKGDKGIDKMIRDMRNVKDMDLGILFATYDIQGCEKVDTHKIIPVKIDKEKTVNLLLIPNIRHERESDYLILRHFITCSDLYMFKPDNNTDFKYAINKTISVLQSSINERKRLIESTQKVLNNEINIMNEWNLYNINEKDNLDKDTFSFENIKNKFTKCDKSIVSIEDLIKESDVKTRDMIKHYFKEDLILKSSDIEDRKKYKEINNLTKMPNKDKNLWLLKGYKLI